MMLGLLTSIPRNVLGADDGEEMHANAAAVPSIDIRGLLERVGGQ